MAHSAANWKICREFGGTFSKKEAGDATAEAFALEHAINLQGKSPPPLFFPSKRTQTNSTKSSSSSAFPNIKGDCSRTSKKKGGRGGGHKIFIFNAIHLGPLLSGDREALLLSLQAHKQNREMYYYSLHYFPWGGNECEYERSCVCETVYQAGLPRQLRPPTNVPRSVANRAFLMSFFWKTWHF